MLYLPDSNILIYAKMAGVPEHRAAANWLTNALNDGSSMLLLCETVVLSFLRICTNAKVFDPPLPLADAEKFISKLVDRSNVHIYRPTAKHFVEVAKFMKAHRLGGNFVMDVHLAVTAIQTGAVLVTRDKDFLKLPHLNVVDPLSNEN